MDFNPVETKPCVNPDPCHGRMRLKIVAPVDRPDAVAVSPNQPYTAWVCDECEFERVGGDPSDFNKPTLDSLRQKGYQIGETYNGGSGLLVVINGVAMPPECAEQLDRGRVTLEEIARLAKAD